MLMVTEVEPAYYLLSSLPGVGWVVMTRWRIPFSVLEDRKAFFLTPRGNLTRRLPGGPAGG